jgi:hypothetical protein
MARQAGMASRAGRRAMNNLVLLLAVLCLPAVAIAVVRNEGRRARERTTQARVVVDVFGVRRELADGRVESVEWGDVMIVEVVRASMGPHKASGGVVLIGGTGDHGALVPLDKVTATGLLGRLGSLPGFDRRAFDTAVTSRAPSRTTVWTHPSAP